MRIPPASTPVACDMSTALDTPGQRLDEYRDLFARTLVAKEETGYGVLFRLRAAPGVEDQVRDLAARELLCCPFFAFEVTVRGDEIHWAAAVSDSDAARAALRDFYDLAAS
ncbi:hypothetical protein [Nonomuraea typhae]|uniref:Uncharacterized protein n=1 Tax=Nonomuraea typhae TaxID=2603600 RepID=A0ABW7Z3I6_9ACTN